MQGNTQQNIIQYTSVWPVTVLYLQLKKQKEYTSVISTIGSNKSVL